MPAGLNNSLGVQLPPLGRCWPREVWLGRISSRIVASEIAGRPNAGRDYISCHDKRLGRFLVGLVKDLGWRMPAGVHGKAGLDLPPFSRFLSTAPGLYSTTRATPRS